MLHQRSKWDYIGNYQLRELLPDFLVMLDSTIIRFQNMLTKEKWNDERVAGVHRQAEGMKYLLLATHLWAPDL